jgi:hypothetical protein
MSDIDDRVDTLRQRLIKTAAVPITMGNYKQQLRTYQEMLLSLINLIDDLNEAIEKEMAKPVGDK